MVSMGDTEISLHIRFPCQGLPKFQFSGGGEEYSEVKHSKCQDLPKFQWGWVGGGLGGILKSNTQSAKICLNLDFGGGGGVF